MRRNGHVRGFSMIELVVVLGVILVMAAIATPSVVRSVRSYRVSATATDVANLLQRARYEAIRRNRVVTSRGQVTAEGQWQIWIDTTANGTLDPDEPFILLPPDMTFLGPGEAPDPSSMGYPNTQMVAGQIAFDYRGQVVQAGGPAAAPVVSVVFVGALRDPSYGYRAVALTPSGKAKIWRAEEGGYWHD